MTTQTKGTLAEALVAFQQEAPQIARTKEVSVKTDKGTYKFKYAPYDAITESLREPLGKNGLAFSQLLTATDAGHPALKTILLHTSGERLEADFPLPVRGGETAQQIGSLVTYMRRYALVSVLGLATEEDDDGNHASGSTTQAVDSPGHSVKVKEVDIPKAVIPKDATQSSPFKQPTLPAGGITEPQRKKLSVMTAELLNQKQITVQQIGSALKPPVAFPEGAPVEELYPVYAELTKAAASELIGRLERFRESVAAA